MSESPNNESSQFPSEDGLAPAAPNSAVSGVAPQKKHVLPSVQLANTGAPILLYPVSADRVISTTSSDGKTIFKIAPAPVPIPEKVSTSEFTYQTIVYLIEAVGRRWNLYGSRERAQLFHGVQKELESHGHCLPVERIRRKWNNLIVTYKRVKDRSRETGQAKTSWEYYEMMDAMLGDTIGAQSGGTASVALVDMANSSKEMVAGHLPCSSAAAAEAKPCLLPGGLVAACAQNPALIPSSLPPPITLHAPSQIPGHTEARQPTPCLPRRPHRLRLRQRLRRAPAEATASFLAQQNSQAEERTALLRSFLASHEERGQLEEQRQGRGEARERRRERRENRMADALGRMATALELLSAKQDTIITLLQRLTDRQ